MKKLVAAFAFVFTIAFAQAQTDSSGTNTTNTTNTTDQTTGTRYEYYPEANVYYNDSEKTYWYHDSASNQWQSGAQLPSTYSIDDKTKKSTVYYNGTDIWKDNANHMKKYGKKGKSKKPM